MDLPWSRIAGVLIALATVVATSACTEDPPPVAALEPELPVVPLVPAPSPPDEAPEPEPEPEPEVSVLATNGRVEVLRREQTDWSELNPGDRLRETDAVRTWEDARLELQVSDIKVSVEERSELRVKTVTDTVLRAQFRGRVASEVTPGKGASIELEAEGSDAVARSEGGAFAMTADGKGIVAVAAVSGRVDFAAKGRSVTVDEGQVSRTRPSGEPEKPKSALKRVLLAVNWPAKKETRAPRIPVRGAVEVGARVTVQGTPVEVDEKGRFVANVSLRPGTQIVTVVATDVLGRTRREQAQVFHDGRPAEVDLVKRPWQ